MPNKKVKPADYLFWAVKQLTGNTLRNHILIILADIKGHKGCYPSHTTVAERCGCKRNAVVRHMKILESEGWVTVQRRGSGGMQTSNDYTLNLDREAVSLEYNAVSERDNPCIPKIQPLYPIDTPPCIPEIHETPSIKHPSKHPVKHTPLPPSGFDEFYSAYPKKADRQGAEKAWNKLNPDHALIIRIHKDLIDRVERGHWCTAKGKVYIPGPAPYLNGHKWQDEIIPRPEFKPKTDYSAIARDFTEI
jgi:hypothetical protein